MNSMLNAFQCVCSYLVRNASNLCLTAGGALILRHILITYGLNSALLAVGVLLIFASLIISVNER